MIQVFRNSISDSANLRALYHHCVNELQLPGEYSDLLRMGFVYCLSALDKLVHDIVTHNMVEIFTGRRLPTPRYFSETVSMENHATLSSSSMPPPEVIFEGIVRAKLAHQSFMDPEKLVDALSLIWNEGHKWQVIAAAMGRDRAQSITELRNLYKRRNAIVHETDRDLSTNQKMPILPEDAERTETFICLLGETIYRIV